MNSNYDNDNYDDNLRLMNNKDDYGFRFREWNVYKDTRKLRIKINQILKDYPMEEKYALVDQTKRALNSIILNLAESTNRNTNKDMKVFINRAHTSLDEVIACMDCALDNGYIRKEKHKEILKEASSIAKRLRKFTQHLSSS